MNNDLDIIYEDNDVIVVNKPAGLTVHPGEGNQSGTLIQSLIARAPEMAKVYLNDDEYSKIRPGLVHRLDRDTSGVMIVAKNIAAMRWLIDQIKSRKVKKIYLTLCLGWPEKEKGELINFLGRHPRQRQKISEIGPERGKEAISRYEVIRYFCHKNFRWSLIKFDLKTGRTHQIRAQTTLRRQPVLGDKKYGNKESLGLSKLLGIKRQMLHATELRIVLPGQSLSAIFKAPLPPDFQKTLDFGIYKNL